MSGELSSRRIEMVIYKGNILFEKQQLHRDYKKFFKKSNIIAYPSGYYDPVSNFCIIGGYQHYNVLNSGLTAFFNTAISTKTWEIPFATANFNIPGPLSNVAIDGGINYSNFMTNFYGIGNKNNAEEYKIYKSIIYKGYFNTMIDISDNKKWSFNTTYTLENPDFILIT